MLLVINHIIFIFLGIFFLIDLVFIIHNDILSKKVELVEFTILRLVIKLVLILLILASIIINSILGNFVFVIVWSTMFFAQLIISIPKFIQLKNKK